MQGLQSSSFTLLENLENRVLFSQINVADFGAVPNDGRDDRGAIQNAINASQPGDTISFDAGEYNSGGMLKLKGNRTYQGKSGATLNTSNSMWAATVEGNTSDVTITGMKFVGAGIDMGGGSFYRNIKITNNEFSDMSGHAIVQRVRTDTLEITNNTFRNIRGYGVIETYNTDRLNYSYNRVIDSTHGGHILGPLQDCTFVGNYMTGLTDWMLEIQDSGSSVSKNMKIENNVSFDYRKGYGNTGGLSVVNHGDGTQIKNNYMRANFLPGTNFSENHLHVAIEWNIESVNGVISGNVVGNERDDQYTFVQGIGYLPISGATMTDNKFFGKFNGGWGKGMPVQIAANGSNNWDRNYGNMPEPPAPLEATPDQPVDRTDDDVDPVDDTPAETPPPIKAAPPSAPGGAVWISDLTWESAENGWGPVETDQSNGERRTRDGEALSLDGKLYRKGLGVAVDSEVVYDLNGEYAKFFSDIGIDDYAGKRGSVTFEVWADGEKVYDSGTMDHDSKSKALAIDVRNVQELKLITTDAGDGGHSDHADWAGARLTPVA